MSITFDPLDHVKFANFHSIFLKNRGKIQCAGICLAEPKCGAFNWTLKECNLFDSINFASPNDLETATREMYLTDRYPPGTGNK